MERKVITDKDGRQWVIYNNAIGKSRAIPLEIAVRESQLRVAFFSEEAVPILLASFQELGVFPELRLVGSANLVAATAESDLDILPVIFDDKLYKPTLEACLTIRRKLYQGTLGNFTPLYRINLHDVYFED